MSLKIVSIKTVGFKIRCKLTNFLNKNVERVNPDGKRMKRKTVSIIALKTAKTIFLMLTEQHYCKLIISIQI